MAPRTAGSERSTPAPAGGCTCSAGPGKCCSRPLQIGGCRQAGCRLCLPRRPGSSTTSQAAAAASTPSRPNHRHQSRSTVWPPRPGPSGHTHAHTHQIHAWNSCTLIAGQDVDCCGGPSRPTSRPRPQPKPAKKKGAVGGPGAASSSSAVQPRKYGRVCRHSGVPRMHTGQPTPPRAPPHPDDRWSSGAASGWAEVDSARLASSARQEDRLPRPLYHAAAAAETARRQSLFIETATADMV